MLGPQPLPNIEVLLMKNKGRMDVEQAASSLVQHPSLHACVCPSPTFQTNGSTLAILTQLLTPSATFARFQWDQSLRTKLGLTRLNDRFCPIPAAHSNCFLSSSLFKDPRPTETAVAPGSLLEVQDLRPHLKSTNQNLQFNRIQVNACGHVSLRSSTCSQPLQSPSLVRCKPGSKLALSTSLLGSGIKPESPGVNQDHCMHEDVFRNPSNPQGIRPPRGH